jgi:hypothetical protein
MTFAAPLFLAAALAAVVPVILHLIGRQRPKHQPFPTLRFLRVSVQQTRRRRQLTDLVLLLLRAALLVLIALGLARPTLTSLKTLFGSGVSAVAVVLDNSASMGTIDHDRQRFETAVNAAGQILDQLRDGDQVVLFPTCGATFSPQGKLARSQAQVRQMLADTKLTYQRANVAARLLEARRLLAAAAATNKQVFVLSDLQRVDWENLPPEDAQEHQPAEEKTAREIPVIVVDCHRAPQPNVAVVGVNLEAALPVAGLPIKVSVELLNCHTAPSTRVVELYLDGNQEAVSPTLTIPGEGRLKHDFVFRLKSGGPHRGEVRLVGDDGNRLDDRRYFSLAVDQGLPVAVVSAPRKGIAFLEDTFYLESALGTGRSGDGALRVSPLTAAQLATVPLDPFKVVYLVNCPAPDASTASRLRAYVEHGGNLVWICGANVVPDQYNAANAGADGRLLPAPLGELRPPQASDGRDSWSIGFLDPAHRALAPLAEPAALYQKVLVYRYVQINAAKAPQAQVLARLDNGEPLLVQRRIERGTVTLLGTSCHRAWTNLPLRPIFVPLVARLTFELCGTAAARYEAAAGTPLVIPFDRQIRPTGVEIVPPSGETIRRSLEETAGKAETVFRYADTQEIGIYTIRPLGAAGAVPVTCAVNFDPAEAPDAKLAHQRLQQLLAPIPVIFAANPQDLSATFQWLRQGRSLWTAALAAVLVALVFETFLSNRLTPKNKDLSAAPGGQFERKG